MPRPPDTYTHAQFEFINSEHQGETVRCVHCRNWTGSVKTLNRKKAHLLNCPQYKAWREAGNGQDLAPPNKYNKRDSTTLSAWEGDTDQSGYVSPYASTPYASSSVTRARNIGISPTTTTTHRRSPPTPGPSSPLSFSPYRLPTTVADPPPADVTKHFDEFFDDSHGQKCMRVRCLSCGFVRAKNSTRQVEHLASCQPFLASTEGQNALANGDLEILPTAPSTYSNAALGNDVWRGGKPNPILQLGPSASRSGGPSRMPPPAQRATAPSLVNHLLNKWPEKLSKANQRPFLTHAGCGTLAASALSHWLGQNGHISRAMINFIGSLIGKVRLVDATNSKQNTQYRALDLLISTVSNLRKEIDFIESTKRRYNLNVESSPPIEMTKAYVDLLASTSDPRSTLLEGMVALWTTEHCYCASWQYAASMASNVPPSSNYSVPSYLTGGSHPYGDAPTPFRPVASSSSDQHVTALQEALIPNWTSREFTKFVDACRAIVDELANAETTGSGRDQLLRCEGVYQQIIFLWDRIWPDVDGMGQEKEVVDGNESSPTPAQQSAANANHPQHHGGAVAGPSGTHPQGNNNGTSSNPNTQQPSKEAETKPEPIEIDDEEAEDDGDEERENSEEGPAMTEHLDSPYGGTGLGAVAAANQAGRQAH